MGCGVLTVAAFGLGIGCGGDDDREASKAPSEQCRDFVASYCGKTAACAQSTDRADWEELCLFDFRVYLPCESVTQVLRNTQTCLDSIDAISCSAVPDQSFPRIPAECQGGYR